MNRTVTFIPRVIRLFNTSMNEWLFMLYKFPHCGIIKVYVLLNYNFLQAELGEMDNWQEDTNAWEDESDAAWEAEEVLR